MKILFVTHRYPPRTGGIETHVREIATRLVDDGHDVVVFSADAGNDVSDRTIDKGVQVRRFRSLSPNGSFYFAPQMTAAIRRADVDVIHAHNYHAFPLFFAAVGVTNEKYVATTHYHGESANEIRNKLLSKYHHFGKWAVQQADEVVAVSEWEQNRLREDFSVEVTVIPNGIDVERFRNAEPKEHYRPYLLCLGRLEEYKGFQHVIRAMVELPEYNLLVAGDGPYRDQLEQITQKENVENQVQFLGYVDETELPRLYAGADVYVTLSDFEAYGITVAEAISAQTPCVVRNIGGLRGWSGTKGVLSIKDTSKETIAQAIASAIDTQPSLNAVTSWQGVVTQLLQSIYNSE